MYVVTSERLDVCNVVYRLRLCLQQYCFLKWAFRASLSSIAYIASTAYGTAYYYEVPSVV